MKKLLLLLLLLFCTVPAAAQTFTAQITRGALAGDTQFAFFSCPAGQPKECRIEKVAAKTTQPGPGIGLDWWIGKTEPSGCAETTSQTTLLPIRFYWINAPGSGCPRVVQVKHHALDKTKVSVVSAAGSGYNGGNCSTRPVLDAAGQIWPDFNVSATAPLKLKEAGLMPLTIPGGKGIELRTVSGLSSGSTLQVHLGSWKE